MTDKELLEKAAKAAGYIDFAPIQTGWDGFIGLRVLDSEYEWKDWNPIANNGDALKLVLDLKMDLAKVQASAGISWDSPDRYAATRRAIVRAAASIAEQ